jgi:hypothetical protein
MDASQGKDSQPSRDETISIGERYKAWREKGFNENTVAVYGMSTEQFRKLMTTGEIPSSSKNLHIPYKKDLAQQGKYIYYCLPFYYALRKQRPDLYKEMLENLGVDNGVVDLGIIQQTQKASGYARAHAFVDRIAQKTGLTINMGLVSLLRWQYTDDVEDLLPDEKEDIVEFEKKVEQEGFNLKDLVREADSRRGILLYLNNSLFVGNQVATTHEDEVELVVATGRPLTIDIISGVEVLSDQEEEELKKEYEI